MKTSTPLLAVILVALLAAAFSVTPSYAPPSPRLVATIQTDKSPGQVWNEAFTEGVNITTPGYAPLSQPVLSINNVKLNDVPLAPDVDWNVTKSRLYILHDATAGDVISVNYLGAYALRETVEISGTVTFDGNPTPSGVAAIQVEDTRTNFTLRTLPTGIGPHPHGDVEVTSFLLTNSSLDVKTAFERGEKLYFLIRVKNNAEVTRSVLVAFNLHDCTNTPLAFDTAIVTLTPKGTFSWTTSGYTIPLWASVGNTQAWVGLHSNWPKSGGYPLAPDTATSLVIIESIYEDPPTNPIPPQPVVNGTYTMLLRLPPDPKPATYEATVCAAHQGYYSEWHSTTFHVVDLAAPPIASFIAKPPMTSANSTVDFDASYSSAEGYLDNVTSWSWNFGDGENDTGVTTSHSYPHNGNYTVTLNVTDEYGYWNTTTKTVRVTDIHDVALTSLQCLNHIYINWSYVILITAKNRGAFTETFTVTAYYDSSIIGTTTVSSLLPQTERLVGIQWNTTGLPMYTVYNVTAEADLPGDVNLSDNTIAFGTTMTKAKGDTNGDRDVDIFDIVFIAGLYGIDNTNLRWNIQADIAPNGKVDIFDVVACAANYGKKY